MRKNIIYFAAIALAAAGTASCGIYGKYDTPQMDVQPADTTIRVPGWGSMFTDPCLQELIDTALSRNTDLQVARLRVEEARASLKSARLAQLPSLTLDAGTQIPGSGGNLDGSDSGRRGWSFSVTGQAGWEVDIFARKANAARSAAASLAEYEAYAQAVQVELIASVAEYYYDLLMLDTQLEISSQTLDSWAESISVLESLKEAGRNNDIAVLQAKAKRLALQASQASIRASVTQTSDALCALMGVSGRDIRRGSLMEQDFPEDFLGGIPAGAVAARPDVRQAESALAQAFYATNEARGALLPSLTLSGTLGWTDSRGRISDPAEWIWNALGSLSAPVFNHGANVAALKIAKARQEEAKLQYRQTLLDAGREVNDALSSCQGAQARIGYDEAQCEALEAAVDKINLMMKYSSTSYLEVLTAQQSLLDAQLSLAQDRSSLFSAYISLFKALGGGVAP